MGKPSFREGLRSFLNARYSLESFSKLFKEKQVPVHRHSLWYYLGGTTLFFIIVQIATGILLLFYYRPTSEGAFESVKFIMTKVEFGWLIRSVHAWSANCVIFSAFVHLLSAFFLRAYRKPRELTWVTGCFLFFLLLGFGFTGYLLPWNTLSYFATKVGTEITAKVPGVGPLLSRILRGGDDVGDATLARFFSIHVAMLPLLLFFLMGIHLLMVQIQGMSWPPSFDSGEPRRSSESGGGPPSVPEEKKNRSIPFFPNFFLRDLVVWLTIFGIILSLSVYFPAELGQKADPYQPTPAGIRPEWYFLFLFQTLKFFPGHVGPFEGDLLAIVLINLAGLGLILTPFLDIWTKRGRFSPFLILGLLGLLYVIAATTMALLAPVH